jgi:hypothetical protein
MKFRKLRIAWSVGCAIACLLLIVLWVRSYLSYDRMHCPLSSLLIDQSLRQRAVELIDGRQRIHGSQLLILHSIEGRLRVHAGGQSLEGPGWYLSWWDVESTPVDNLSPHRTTRVSPRWNYGFGEYGRYAEFPHWFPVVFFGGLATIPWLHWSKRFSLRTLLIAMTLVAVALGIIVAAT